MVKTVGLERTAKKWLSRAAVATDDYKAGVSTPKEPWLERAIAAKDTYKAAVTATEVPDLFVRGLRRAGVERWQGMALRKGADRFSPGITLSEPYYRGQMTDVLGVVERITLPTRMPRGDVRNFERSKRIGVELHAWRLAQRAAPPTA